MQNQRKDSPLKIYLSARYSRREELQQYRARIRNAGHVVTSSWLDTDFELGPDGRSLEAAPEIRAQVAQQDIEDMEEASITITFTEPGNGGRGGRHVEFGIAIGFGHELIVIGPQENVFHCLNRVERFDTFEEFAAEYLE